MPEIHQPPHERVLTKVTVLEHARVRWQPRLRPDLTTQPSTPWVIPSETGGSRAAAPAAGSSLSCNPPTAESTFANVCGSCPTSDTQSNPEVGVAGESGASATERKRPTGHTLALFPGACPICRDADTNLDVPGWRVFSPNYVT